VSAEYADAFNENASIIVFPNCCILKTLVTFLKNCATIHPTKGIFLHADRNKPMTGFTNIAKDILVNAMNAFTLKVACESCSIGKRLSLCRTTKNGIIAFSLMAWAVLWEATSNKCSSVSNMASITHFMNKILSR